MNIDFVKLLKLILPTFMRNALDSIVKAIASQFTSLYADFQLWQIDIRLQAAMTAQVMYMETILNYRLLNSFLRIIYITDGDGVNVDFIVNVPSGVNVDNYRLIALIEKYKASGKRYTIAQSSYVYEITWTNPVCELVDQQFIAKWTNPVCEMVDMNVNKVVASLYSHVDSGGAHQYAYVQLQYNATSNLTVVVATNLGNYTVAIASGTKTGMTSSGAFDTNTYSISSITPSIDETYYYQKSTWPL